MDWFRPASALSSVPDIHSAKDQWVCRLCNVWQISRNAPIALRSIRSCLQQTREKVYSYKFDTVTYGVWVSVFHLEVTHQANAIFLSLWQQILWNYRTACKTLRERRENIECKENGQENKDRQAKKDWRLKNELRKRFSALLVHHLYLFQLVYITSARRLLVL